MTARAARRPPRTGCDGRGHRQVRHAGAVVGDPVDQLMAGGPELLRSHGRHARTSVPDPLKITSRETARIRATSTQRGLQPRGPDGERTHDQRSVGCRAWFGAACTSVGRTSSSLAALGRRFEQIRAGLDVPESFPGDVLAAAGRAAGGSPGGRRRPCRPHRRPVRHRRPAGGDRPRPGAAPVAPWLRLPPRLRDRRRTGVRHAGLAGRRRGTPPGPDPLRAGPTHAAAPTGAQ